ncbi:MAG: hypothetical protein M1829_004649 [Trizodia sp. TS-e1964]|nr:MAG: hypothetical protein M1829_004649 [Trizodia sp. TS-e1964]
MASLPPADPAPAPTPAPTTAPAPPTAPAPAAEPPWYAAYPAPRKAPRTLTRQELLQFFKEGKQGGQELILIDVRRTDFVDHTIRGAINIPAQSIYATLPALFNLFCSTGTRRVVWFCETGSSRGRGTRAAGWFADYVHDQSNFFIESHVLEGGINGWVEAGGEYLEFVDKLEAGSGGK